MAKYTTHVRSIVEAGVNIFDFDYPLFDPKYKGVLEQKIIDTYYFREIEGETVAQWKHRLKVKLNNILPYYNKLYETEGIVTIENYNINLDNTITKSTVVDQTTTGKADSDNTTTASGNNKEIFSDTPQAKLSGLDYATNLTEGETDTTANDKGTTTSEGTAKTIEEYTEHLLGNGSMRYNADILMEFRKSFLNIDNLIIDELRDLFVNIY
jgi:hypothetical protein